MNFILCEGMRVVGDIGPVTFGIIPTGDWEISDLNSGLFVIK